MGRIGFCGLFWESNPIYKIVHVGKDNSDLKRLIKKRIFEMKIQKLEPSYTAPEKIK